MFLARAITASLVALGGAATAADLTVPTGHSTIMGAMAAAQPGDTVRVLAGTYTEENITIKDRVNLVGAGASATFLNGSTPVKAGSGGVIEGFTLTGRGIACNNTSPVIRHNVVRGARSSGIQLTGNSWPVIYRNFIYNNISGISFLNGGATALIVNNTIVDNVEGHGITQPYGAYLTQNNLVVGNDQGLSDCYGSSGYNGGYNDAWRNRTDWRCFGLSPGDISKDPLFKKAPRQSAQAYQPDQTELGWDTVRVQWDWTSRILVGDHIEIGYDKVDRVVTEVAFAVDQYEYTRIRFTPALPSQPFYPLTILDWGNTSDFTYDLTLQPGSPAIDAGNPDPIWNDADGSRNDIGATGGTGHPAVWEGVPPGPVANLQATAGDAEISLSWTPPSDADVKGFLILRRAKTPPAGIPTAGISYTPYLTPYANNTEIGDSHVVYFGTDPKATGFTDTNRYPGVTYHYAVFAFDAFYNYSTGLTTSAAAFHEPMTFTVSATGGAADYTGINEAVQAAKPGDTVFVMNGAYTESITLRNGVRIRGESRDGVVLNLVPDGYSVFAATQVPYGSIENLTLLGDGTGWVIALALEKGTTVDLIDITVKGFAVGGLYRGDTLSPSSLERMPTIRGCLFEANGTGLWLKGGTNAIVNGNTFIGSTSGVKLEKAHPEIFDNDILGSTYNGIEASDGSSPIIHDNRITGGFTGIGLAQASSARVYRNIVTDNSVTGISCVYISTPNIHNNIIARNGGEGVWVHMSWARLHNNTIVGNGGNGIEVEYHGSIEAINNIIAFNEGWGSAAGEDYYLGTPSLSYNTLFGNTLGNTSPSTKVLDGNIESDPLFRDRVGGDYQLALSSPCIDAGNPDAAYNDPDGTRNDMGAYGGPDAFPTTPLGLPTVVGIAPVSGPMAGGTEVTITGSGFQPGAVVTIGPIPAVVGSVSSTTIVATTGASHISGLVSVVVTNLDGGFAGLPNSFTYEPPPCDDTVQEICDGVDNDCDGLIDDADPSVTGQPAWYADSDGDGHGNPNATKLACVKPAGYVADKTDCNDANAAIKPGAAEICDGVDNNCDGQIDEGVTRMFYPDKDNDGFGDPLFPTSACQPPTGYVVDNTDCNDANPAVKPGAAEVCDDGLDNDCNGLVDGSDPACGGAASHGYYFPSIKDNDLIGWENYLTVQAKDPVSMDVTIRVYGMNGLLLGTYIYSDTNPVAKSPSIAPYARVAQRPSMVVGTTTNPVAVEGSMIVETSVPAIATTNTIANSFEGFSIYEAAKPRSMHNFPKAYDGPNNYQVYMLAQNIHATPIKVTATLYGKDAGSPGHGAKKTFTVPAYGTLKFRPAMDIAGGIDFTGSVTISSDGAAPGDGKGPAIPAMCRYELGKEAMTIYESTMTQPALYFPTMKDGKFGGSMEYQNYLSVVNPNVFPVTVEAILYANIGAKQGTTGPVVLPADGKITWRPAMIRGSVPAPIDFEGSVVVTSSAPVIGQTNTMYPGANLYQCDAFDLLESAIPNSTLFFPKAFDNIVGTGHLYDNFVYVQNPDATVKGIKIEQFNNDGTPNGFHVVSIGPNATYVFRPKNLVTDSTVLFRGSVRVTETKGLPITGAIKYDIHQGATAVTPVDAMTLYRSMGQDAATGVVWQPINQNLGIMDAPFDNQDCAGCHGSTPNNPTGPTVHHVTASAMAGDCVVCHGSFVQNMNDGHAIPTYSPSLVTPGTRTKSNGGTNGEGHCMFCHVVGIYDGPGGPAQISSIAVLHHGNGLPMDSTTCVWCHATSGGNFENSVRTCEKCHGVESLHSIQADSNGNGFITPGAELPNFGHIGSEKDCFGCHGFQAPTGVDPATMSNPDKHHRLYGTPIPAGSEAPYAKTGLYGCLSCHKLEWNPLTNRWGFYPFRDCAACHPSGPPMQ